MTSSCTVTTGQPLLTASRENPLKQQRPEATKTKINKFYFIYLFFQYHLTALIGEGDGTPLQCSCLENPMDGGARQAAVHEVAQSRTGLSDFTFTFHFPALEKEMATHSSVLAWRIPGTGEPGGLPSIGSHRVGHDSSDLAAAAGVQVIHIWRDYFRQAFLKYNHS